jgi:hypothetical protein
VKEASRPGRIIAIRMFHLKGQFLDNSRITDDRLRMQGIAVRYNFRGLCATFVRP